jgi:hypothetical protein
MEVQDLRSWSIGMGMVMLTLLRTEVRTALSCQSAYIHNHNTGTSLQISGIFTC